MSVRAKFKVDSVQHTNQQDPTNEGYTVTMSPVISGSKENEEFYKWTPGGQLLLSTVNVDAGKQFEIGKEFYIDITPAN